MAKKKEVVKTPKKRGFSDYILYILIAVAIIVIGIWAGYVIDETSNKKGADYQKALTHYAEYLTPQDFMNAAVKAVSDDKSYARKFAVITFLVGILIFAIAASQSNKRYHRKGEEHGSARWGTDKEKKIIQDENDFNNNVIIASDVFLVLDRGKREQNALTPKEKKQIEARKEKEKADELARKARLKAEYENYLKKNSPMGNCKNAPQDSAEILESEV